MFGSYLLQHADDLVEQLGKARFISTFCLMKEVLASVPGPRPQA